MRNLIQYKNSSMGFHKDIVTRKYNKKDDPGYKQRLKSMNGKIEPLFDVFQQKFNDNCLEDLTAHTFTRAEKDDLNGLYVYKSKKIQELKILLTTDENNRVINTCQNCTIGEINSLDHYLPRTEFIEYIVNPLNLIPSCTKCNDHKGSIWRQGGKRKFLNLYLDILPEVQYLFVKINIDNDVVDLSYFIKNQSGIDEELYCLISSHYNDLKLCGRFKENSDTVISELDSEIRSYLRKLELSEIKETIIEDCQRKKKLLGKNSWKLILISTLIENDIYMNRFKKKVTLL